MLEILLPNKNLKIQDMKDLIAYSVYASGEGVADRCILIRNQKKVLVARLFEDTNIKFFSLRETGFENGKYQKPDDSKEIQYVIIDLKEEYLEMSLDDYFVDVYLEKYNEYFSESKKEDVYIIDTFVDILKCSKEEMINLFT